MSAIWGCIDLNKKELDLQTAEKMEEAFGNYRIDRFEHRFQGEAVMGCCHQYLTPEASREQLPWYDPERRILFTADAVLDNRQELRKELGEMDPGSEAPDGAFLYAAYRKWGPEFTAHVLGAFSSAFYHQAEGRLELYTDHTNNRCLFYYKENDRIYFATLPGAIVEAASLDVEEKWLAGFLAHMDTEMMIFRGLTPFQGVYQMEAANQLMVTAEDMSIRQYWSPEQLPYGGFTAHPEQYRDKFVDTLRLAVTSMLRSSGETGCTLSSGLDSTSVACLAAPKLKEQGKMLFSYTSVPLPDYISDTESYHIADETSGVREIARVYDNITPTFLDCQGKDGFTGLPVTVEHLGYPGKSGHNNTWLQEIYGAAQKQGCRLVLKGQYGNTTISYGKLLTVLYQELRHGRVGLAYHNIRRFQTHYHVPASYIGKAYWKEWRERWKPLEVDWSRSLIRGELKSRYQLDVALNEAARGTGGGEMDSAKERRRFLFNPQGLMVLGLFDTAMGLTYGLLVRDPTRDRRVVELCCRLPVECMLADGWERGMVRSYLRGIVPDIILDNIQTRGLQSADELFRTRKHWDQERDQIWETIASSGVKELLDPQVWKALEEDIQHISAEELTRDLVRKSQIVYACALFLLKWKKGD